MGIERQQLGRRVIVGIEPSPEPLYRVGHGLQGLLSDHSDVLGGRESPLDPLRSLER